MLDVHPPHHPTHTWKDFFIHIATICVGLLIAIGLEQTVELIHHRHERHLLEQQLRAETLRNLNVALANIDDYRQAVQAGETLYNELQAAARDHRTPRMAEIPRARNVVKPAAAVWSVAQQSGRLELLPSAEAQRYVRLYSIGDQVSTCLLQTNEVLSQMFAVLRPALLRANVDSDVGDASLYDLSRLSTDQMQRFADYLAQFNAAQRYCITRNAMLYGIAWSAWRGSTSDQQNLRVAIEASHISGGTDAILAKYPLPEAAKHAEQTGEDE